MMSGNVGDGAKRLGQKLLEEVEVENLTSVLKSLRELGVKKDKSSTNTITKQNGYFNIQPLDALLPPGPPILELISPPPTHHPYSAGKTSLLYLLIAHAILPASFSSTKLGGHDAAIILFDPSSHFSVSRLSSVMFDLLCSSLQASGKIIDEAVKADVREVVKRSLHHVHIFRPQSWTASLATLRGLPDYLFDGTRHKSMHRRIHSIILEDIDAFVWDIRSSSYTTHSTSTNPLSTASAHLTTNLAQLSKLFSCATILTSLSSSSNSFRPHLPTQWPQGSLVTRLAVRRVEVLKFPPVIGVQEAEAERLRRWDVVARGRFECWKVGMSVRDGEGFVFRIGERGVEIEQDG